MTALSRRQLLAAGGAGLLAPTLTACGNGQTGQRVASTVVLPPMFTVPLTIPDVARPMSTSGNANRYRVVAQVRDLDVIPGRTTSMLTYGGTYPGPTFATRRGRPLVVEHVNELPVPTVVHLHGGVVAAEHDGFPTDLLLPAGGDAAHAQRHDPDASIAVGAREYRYHNDQGAATLWYHDHRMDFTGPQVYRGLAGFHLVRDDVDDALGLPDGDRDLPLMIADRSFGADGELVYPSLEPSLLGRPGVQEWAMEGVLGDVVLVNGAPWPVAAVDGARHRLRLCNASNVRRYALRLVAASGQSLPMVQVASDGGLLAAPLTRQSVTLAPGERVEVVVDLGAVGVGTRVEMRNDLGDGGTSRVMAFDVVRRAGNSPPVPSALTTVEPYDPDEVVEERTFRFALGSHPDLHGGEERGWLVNGLPFSPSRVDASIVPGRLERWRLSTDSHHPVHVHLAQFQVESRGGGDLDDGDVGWKDTVDVRPAEFVDVLVRFPDMPGRYMVHCHNLEHEDMAMMATIAVV